MLRNHRRQLAWMAGAGTLLFGSSNAVAQCFNQTIVTLDNNTVYQQTVGPRNDTRVVTTFDVDGNGPRPTEFLRTPNGNPIVRLDAAGAGTVTVEVDTGLTFDYEVPEAGQYLIVVPVVPTPPNSPRIRAVSGPGNVAGSGSWDPDGNSQFPLGTVQAIPGIAFSTQSGPTCGPVSGSEDFPKIARLSQDLAASEIGTFHEREGGLENISGSFFAWSRLFGQTTFDTNEDETQRGAQLGVGVIIPNPGFTTRLSVFGSFADASGDYSVTSADIEHSGVGVTLTFLTTTAYLDLVGKWSDVDIEASTGFDTSSSAGNIATGSVEGGLSFPIGGGTVLQPQAQFIYSSLDLDDISVALDPLTLRTGELQDGDSLRGRLGLRLSNTTVDPGVAEYNVWGRLDLWGEFLGENDFRVTDVYTGSLAGGASATDLVTNGDGDIWVDLTAGFAVTSMVYGVSLHGALKTSFEESSTSVGGSAGLKVPF